VIARKVTRVFDCKIVDGVVITDGSQAPRDVAIEHGTIAEIGVQGSLGPSRVTLDATGLFVLPGGVDAHFHCRAPSHPERGDFRTETRAAAAGGMTTVLEMPISIPTCITPEVLHSRRELGERESYVDFGLFAGGAVTSAQQALALRDAGAIGFKIFTITPPPHRSAEFTGLFATSEAAIYSSLGAIRETGLVTTVHAENQSLLDAFHDEDTHLARPPIAESVEIALLGTIAKELSTQVHIAHMTSRSALEAVRAARSVGSPLTAETCPQYLALDTSAIDRYGSFAKVHPPLRGLEDQASLWEGLRDGSIALVASDHAPFHPDEKRGVDYALAPPGVPSVELALPVVLDGAIRGLLPIESAVALVSEAPARLFKLFPRKGSIRIGADADVVLFSPDARWRVETSSLFTKSAASSDVWNGIELAGRIVGTMVNGRAVFWDGEIQGEPEGSFVTPTAGSEVP
jgi:dihydroorotase (multifunctional complex type)